MLNKSCGIFIGSTMYTNQASRNNPGEDYCAELLKWEMCKVQRNKNLGPFYSGAIEHVQMKDLVFKHGFPYLFIHQGNCEHRIVIEKIR